MSNPFHSFHVQKGGISLKKLSKHYRKLSKNKSPTFQPLTFQEKEDLVVPMDLLHVPHHQCHSQKPEDYYMYPEHQSSPTHGILEIIQLHTTPQKEHAYEHPSVIDDELFEELFQHISTAPRSKKQYKASRTLKKKEKKPKRNTRRVKSV